MVATEGQIMAAQNSIDIFEKYLNKGANDKIKALIKVIKDQGGDISSPINIANAINNAFSSNPAQTAAKKVHDSALAKVNEYDGVKKCVGSSIAELCQGDAIIIQFLNDIYKGKGINIDINNATVDQIDNLKPTGVVDDTARKDAINTININGKMELSALGNILGINSPKYNTNGALYFTPDGEFDTSNLAANNVRFNKLETTSLNPAISTFLSGDMWSLTGSGTDTKKVTQVITYGDKISNLFPTLALDLKSTSKKIGDEDFSTLLDKNNNPTDLAKALFGDDVTKLMDLAIKAKVQGTYGIKNALTEIEKYIKDPKNFPSTSSEHPIVTAAKTTCPSQISKKDDATEATIQTCFADTFKEYGFINAILKNVPNKGTNIVTPNDGNAFTNYASNNLTGADLKAATAYFKIVATACGTGPFVTGADIPNPKNEKGQVTTIVTDCLKQANTIAATILFNAECGKDKLANNQVADNCYKALADKAGTLYNNGDTDAMWIDLSGEYPYDMKFADLPKLDL